MTVSPAAVRLDNVGLRYVLPNGTDLVLFEGLTEQVVAGQLVAVAGRSGSGKTSLLSLASGLRRPTSGAVSWNGVGINDLSADELAAQRLGHIGIVFQDGALLEHLTAIENVAIGSLRPGSGRPGREQATTALSQVGLLQRSGHFPAQMSGGERQRVALARGLFGDPALLVVDEPTANLDRRSADGIISLLGELAHNGRAMLVATHDEHLLAIADRRIVLD